MVSSVGELGRLWGRGCPRLPRLQPEISARDFSRSFQHLYPSSESLTLLYLLSGASGGKLNPPPAPPARSPTTELSSRSQQAWPLSQQAGGQLKNGNLHTADDFETKFTFHSVEDFPPPDEYKPCQKIYPSKIPRSHTPGPWLQAEATGPGSDDARGRNSQSALKTLR